ncbi:MAG: bifunctional nuclease family protein [Acidimicrobiales bacterium]
MVEMHLEAVRVELPTSTPVLLLQEVGGAHRTLPIYIGNAEAQAIAYTLQGIVTPRPMTHDLMREIIEELGATVECVVITELRDRTFFAEVRVNGPGRKLAISARPSDAIALAIRIPAPIYADDALVEAEGIVLEDAEGDQAPESEELVTEFREFIEGVKPEDFSG